MWQDYHLNWHSRVASALATIAPAAPPRRMQGSAIRWGLHHLTEPGGVEHPHAAARAWRRRAAHPRKQRGDAS